MRVLGWTCVAVSVLMLAGCGGGAGGATPEETFKKFKSAMTDKKFDNAWDLLSSESQAYWDAAAKKIAARAKKVLKETESQERITLEAQAKVMEVELKDMAEMDGKAMVIAAYKRAAKNDKGTWARLSQSEFLRDEKNETGDRAKVFVTVDGKPQESDPIPLVLEKGKWKVDFRSVPAGAPQ